MSDKNCTHGEMFVCSQCSNDIPPSSTMGLVPIYSDAPAQPSGEEEARAWLLENFANAESWLEYLGEDNAEAMLARMAAYAAQQKERDARIAESIGHTGKYIAHAIREQPDYAQEK